MILLDTNVVSALLRPEQEPKIVYWLNDISEGELCTSAVTLFELRFGIERMPASRRRAKLAADVDLIVEHILGNRVLGFDDRAAAAAASLRVRRKRSGGTIEVADTFIAGIAIAHACRIATRNRRHFSGLALEVIDPWAAVP